jgi:hypothetical protein
MNASKAKEKISRLKCKYRKIKEKGLKIGTQVYPNIQTQKTQHKE